MDWEEFLLQKNLKSIQNFYFSFLLIRKVYNFYFFIQTSMINSSSEAGPEITPRFETLDQYREAIRQEESLHTETGDNQHVVTIQDLRGEMDVNAKLRPKLPIAAAAALGAGFVVSGGIGATMRLLMRRGREGKTKARFGPFSLVDRD